MSSVILSVHLRRTDTEQWLFVSSSRSEWRLALTRISVSQSYGRLGSYGPGLLPNSNSNRTLKAFLHERIVSNVFDRNANK